MVHVVTEQTLRSSDQTMWTSDNYNDQDDSSSSSSNDPQKGRAKQGRKRKISSASVAPEDEEQEVKRRKNREAAKRCRDKKQQQTDDLKYKNGELEKENCDLAKQRDELIRKCKEYQQEIEQHKQQGCMVPHFSPPYDLEQLLNPASPPSPSSADLNLSSSPAPSVSPGPPLCWNPPSVSPGPSSLAVSPRPMTRAVPAISPGPMTRAVPSVSPGPMTRVVPSVSPGPSVPSISPGASSRAVSSVPQVNHQPICHPRNAGLMTIGGIEDIANPNLPQMTRLQPVASNSGGQQEPGPQPSLQVHPDTPDVHYVKARLRNGTYKLLCLSHEEYLKVKHLQQLKAQQKALREAELQKRQQLELAKELEMTAKQEAQISARNAFMAGQNPTLLPAQHGEGMGQKLDTFDDLISVLQQNLKGNANQRLDLIAVNPNDVLVKQEPGEQQAYEQNFLQLIQESDVSEVKQEVVMEAMQSGESGGGGGVWSSTGQQIRAGLDVLTHPDTAVPTQGHIQNIVQYLEKEGDNGFTVTTQPRQASASAASLPQGQTYVMSPATMATLGRPLKQATHSVDRAPTLPITSAAQPCINALENFPLNNVKLRPKAALQMQGGSLQTVSNASLQMPVSQGQERFLIQNGMETSLASAAGGLANLQNGPQPIITVLQQGKPAVTQALASFTSQGVQDAMQMGSEGSQQVDLAAEQCVTYVTIAPPDTNGTITEGRNLDTFDQMMSELQKYSNV